ncbi:hypothetical protein HYU19_00100 [Candidatus Woesearchaeota archaeon]|nr:hypothetical protein [Candidatus Woesearchaeota archaeon]
MALRELLQDRAAINILKMAYDRERQDKEKSYTITLQDAMKKLGLLFQPDASIRQLAAAEFIAAETVEGTTYISITNRGRAFIEVFDQLVEAYQKAAPPPAKPRIKIKYNLTDHERKLLLAATRLRNDSGQEFVPLASVVKEIFPDHDPRRKMSAAVQQVLKLEELQFMERKKQDKKALVKVTEKGYNSIKDAYEKGLMG